MVAFMELINELYEPETRSKRIADAATKLGAEKVLSAEKIEEMAALSTVDGLKAKKEELKELAAPYIAKVKDTEGRKELVAEATDLANEKLIKPVVEYTSEKVEAVKVAGKEYATEKMIKPASEKVEAVKELAAEKVLKPTKELAEPYLAKSSEMAAPYLAKMEAKRAELVASKRYEKAVSALKELREHPVETAAELKSKAIDLLKYDALVSYREYVQSDEFHADTMRLVKVELPAIANSGIEKLKVGATTLAADIEAKRGQILLTLERGYSATRQVELADLKEKMKLLLAEFHSEGASLATHVKEDGFSFTDAVARLKKVAAAIDSILVAPLLAAGGDTAPEATAEEVAVTDEPAASAPSAEEPFATATEEEEEEVPVPSGEAADGEAEEDFADAEEK